MAPPAMKIFTPSKAAGESEGGYQMPSMSTAAGFPPDEPAEAGAAQ